ncbi:hypothetical protein ACT47M_001084 [Cronobacter muytjensii]
MTKQKTFENKNLPEERRFVASGHIFAAANFFNHKNALLIVSSDSSSKRQIDVAECFRRVASGRALAKLLITRQR